ncbi:MAG: hypothetical protein U1G08_07495 [Verrucomicrobiota bacterium]
MSAKRFTLDGSDTLEAYLGDLCGRVRDGIRGLIPADRLDAVLLGGGYGRGEGGVLRTPSGDRPYNDLESFVFVRGNALLAERRFRGPLHELGERLSPGTGLDIEFKVLTLDRLRRSPTTMFYYDLVQGHQCLVGNESALAGCEHHRDATRIPLHEATRLLMNRCSGLLFSLERLERDSFGPEEADFVGRNVSKAQLAFGDVLLTAAGQYHWSCRERHERLKHLVAADEPGLFPRPEAAMIGRELVAQHREGVEFKLHPIRSTLSREALAERHERLVRLGLDLWLALENRRIGIGFPSVYHYANWPGNKCPEQPGIRNRLVNLRAFGPRVLLQSGAGRHPRERLLNSLPRLLWLRSGGAPMDPEYLPLLQRDLDTQAPDFPSLVGAYAKLWSRFN